MVWWTYFKTLKKKFGRQKVHSFQKNKMADEREAVMVMLLNELIDSDEEKPMSGNPREWIWTREEKLLLLVISFFFQSFKISPSNLKLCFIIHFFIQHFIQHGKIILDEMLGWFSPAFTDYLNHILCFPLIYFWDLFVSAVRTVFYRPEKVISICFSHLRRSNLSDGWTASETKKSKKNSKKSTNHLDGHLFHLFWPSKNFSLDVLSEKVWLIRFYLIIEFLMAVFSGCCCLSGRFILQGS